MRALFVTITSLPTMLAFLIAPRWMVRHTLYGRMLAYGIARTLIPRAAIDELVDDALDPLTQGSLSPGLAERGANAYRAADLIALHMAALMLPASASTRGFLTSAQHTYQVLRKHGVQTSAQPVDWREMAI